MESYQQSVSNWMIECFGTEVTKDKSERNCRFIEEALELVQARGMSKEDVLKLVDYTYGRPIGEVKQEIGGVMVTLAALANTDGIDIVIEADKELTRCWLKIDKIRQKQKDKPHNSPLPK